MSFSSTTNKYQYTANGVTTVFSFPVLFYLDSDVVVTTTNLTTGVTTTKTLTTDYTISGAANPAGGSITFLVAPANGLRVTIKRVAPITQLTVYVLTDQFPSTVTEKNFDKLTMVCQQLQEQLNRCLQYDASEVTLLSSATLTLAAQRASSMLGFDASGLPTYVLNGADSAVAAAASAAAAAISATSSGGSATASAVSAAAALVSQTAAGTSATNAATSAAAALVSQGAAATSQTAAATSDTNSATSAAAALVSQNAAAVSAAAALVSQNAAAASAASVAALAGVDSSTLTNANVSRTYITNKSKQLLSGTLSGAVVINMTRTSVTGGEEFRFSMQSVVTTGTFTLTFQENSSGSLIIFNSAKTLNGEISFWFNGTAWVINNNSVYES